MAQICLYFQLHQPYRLGDFDIFDLGLHHDYFSSLDHRNQKIFQKVAQKSYLPMLDLLLTLCQQSADFYLTLSVSGVFVQQALVDCPEVISKLKQLAKTGQVEFLAETYYHSLASLFSETEFKNQVALHVALIEELFNQTPTVFRNTELVYSNHIGYQVFNLGFEGMLTEAVPKYLNGQGQTQLFVSAGGQKLPLLLKHSVLSDDIAFRFSDKTWPEYPITVAKYLNWLGAFGADDLINLFMDFETFGEHQWQETGIFEFFRQLVQTILTHKWHKFITPSHIFSQLPWQKKPESKITQAARVKRAKLKHHLKPLTNLPIYDVPYVISWADTDRDLTAWLDNPLQQDTIKQLYNLESSVYRTGSQQLLIDWRKLQTSDHFYYMCTKWSADGDVHAYFNPYSSPLEAYRKYSLVLADLKSRLV